MARCGKTFLDGIARSGILSCARHFPGESSAVPDAESRLAVSGKPMAALWREDLVPYRELLPRLPMVALSSASFKAYDFDAPVPACFLPNVLGGLLRTKLRYAGVAISADLSAPPISNLHSPGEAAVKALGAGCDAMVLCEGSEETLQFLDDALHAGGLAADRVSQALSRLRGIERRINLPSGKISSRAFDRLARQFEEFSREFSVGE